MEHDEIDDHVVFDSDSLTNSDPDDGDTRSTVSSSYSGSSDDEGESQSSSDEQRLLKKGSWGSWTIQESMDTDHFFLIPPSSGSGAGLPPKSFVLPAAALRRSAEQGTVFGTPPPERSIDTHGNGNVGGGSLVSPTAVANQDINRNSSVPSSSLAYRDSAQSIFRNAFDRDGKSDVENDSDDDNDGGDDDDDDDDATPFRNLYQDDQDEDSLYLDDECLVDMTEPPYKPDKLFVTTEEAVSMPETHATSPISVAKLWRNLTIGCCLPTRNRPKHSVAATPSIARPHHHRRRGYSDPSLLALRWDEQHIFTKRTLVESANEPRQKHSSAGGKACPLLPPTTAIKFQLSRKLLPQELTSHALLSSDAVFVLDDTCSLPDDLMMPDLEGGD